jgi:superfamily I DNA/RNA helicase
MRHFPRIGVLETLPDGAFHDLCRQTLDHLQSLWMAMQYLDSNLPLGHDGYLKLWAVSNPQVQVDYIMVDEAQDLNPVLLGVLEKVTCPVVYVGSFSANL